MPSCQQQRYCHLDLHSLRHINSTYRPQYNKLTYRQSINNIVASSSIISWAHRKIPVPIIWIFGSVLRDFKSIELTMIFGSIDCVFNNQ